MNEIGLYKIEVYALKYPWEMGDNSSDEIMIKKVKEFESQLSLNSADPDGNHIALITNLNIPDEPPQFRFINDKSNVNWEKKEE